MFVDIYENYYEIHLKNVLKHFELLKTVNKKC